MKAAKVRWQDAFPNCARSAERIYDIIRPNRKGKPLLPVRNPEDELKLDDLKDVSPTFISNITVNDWQISSDAKSSHQLISFSSKGVELIGNDWEKPSELSKCFEPKHMRLSAAMAISGAAVSYDMGSYESGLDMVLDLLNLLGLGMGDEMVSDQCHCQDQSESTAGKMKQVMFNNVFFIFRGVDSTDCKKDGCLSSFLYKTSRFIRVYPRIKSFNYINIISTTFITANVVFNPVQLPPHLILLSSFFRLPAHFSVIAFFSFISLSRNQYGRDTRWDKSLRHVAATGWCNKSPRVTCENHCRCDRILSLRSVAQIQTGQRLVAAAVQTRRLVAAFVASCVSAYIPC